MIVSFCLRERDVAPVSQTTSEGRADRQVTKIFSMVGLLRARLTGRIEEARSAKRLLLTPGSECAETAIVDGYSKTRRF
jgi:hypothetical protein